MRRPWNSSRTGRPLLWGILLSGPLLGGCLMHSFGQGARADMHGEQGVDLQATLEKEVQRDDLTVTLQIPPLHTGKQSELIVKVRDSRSGAPVRDVRVSIAVVPLKAGVEDSRPDGDTVTLQAREGPEVGVYVASHGFETPGSYEFVAEVHAGAESSRRPPLIVAARQDVFSGMDATARRLRSPLFMLGAVAMLVMMAVFML